MDDMLNWENWWTIDDFLHSFIRDYKRSINANPNVAAADIEYTRFDDRFLFVQRN